MPTHTVLVAIDIDLPGISRKQAEEIVEEKINGSNHYFKYRIIPDEEAVHDALMKVAEEVTREIFEDVEPDPAAEVLRLIPDRASTAEAMATIKGAQAESERW